MRYYVEINGNSSLDIIGLAISELPSISKPLIRTQREEIDGRDGDIITKLGYSAYDKTLKIGLWGNYDINEVIAFFNTDGKITFSNEPDKYYYFTILNRADFINQLETFRTATITIHCQPFKYMEQESPEFEREYVEKSGTSITWDNSLEHAIKDLSLKGNTSQTGTPTPSSPIAVNVVSGDNEIIICKDNLFDKSKITANSALTAEGGITSNNSYSVSTYIRVRPNTTYTFKANSNEFFGICTYNESKTFIERSFGTGNTDYRTFTAGNNVAYIRTQCLNTNVDNFQMVLGNQIPSTYEAYNGITYPINLPVENLFQLPNNETANGITFTKNDDGTFNLSGTASAQTGFRLFVDYNDANIKDGKTYTFSANKSLPSGVSVRAEIYNDTTWIRAITNDLTSTAQTTTGTANLTGGNKIRYSIWVSNGTQVNITNCGIQLEEGTKANTFTPYGTTPIELCKIGTYQDYFYKDSGKWYLHKEIGKYIIDGSETLSAGNINTDSTNTTRVLTGVLTNAPSIANFMVLSNQFIGKANWSLDEEGAYTNNVNLVFRINKTNGGTTTDSIKSWFSSHNASIYYGLATPTNTEITYTPLINQLDAINEANSKDGTTNLTQVNNDLPFMITASVLCGTANLIVNNLGNIIAKPVMTITGSGDIGVYLNGSQIFNIALGDEEYITIDIPNMEAHKDDTLKNRLVVGDYNSFVLQPGENTISFTGDVSDFDITNYSRWI